MKTNRSYTNKQIRRIRESRRRRKILIVAVSLALSIIVIGAVHGSASITKAASEDVTAGLTKCYTSVMVKDGDSLWELAADYKSCGYTDRRDFIKEIQQLNQLSGDSIHTGEYICVPYYQSL